MGAKSFHPAISIVGEATSQNTPNVFQTNSKTYNPTQTVKTS